MSALLCTLSAGDHVISVDDVYGGTNRLMNKIFTKYGIKFSTIDFTKPLNVKKAI